MTLLIGLTGGNRKVKEWKEICNSFWELLLGAYSPISALMTRGRRAAHGFVKRRYIWIRHLYFGTDCNLLRTSACLHYVTDAPLEVCGPSGKAVYMSRSTEEVQRHPSAASGSTADDRWQASLNRR